MHTGVLLDFISVPVSIGFTSATSVIIIVSQLKGLLGLKFSSNTFVDNVTKVFKNLPDIRLGDTFLGFVCIVTLLVLRVKIYPVRNSENITHNFALESERCAVGCASWREGTVSQVVEEDFLACVCVQKYLSRHCLLSHCI
jgi:Sulfate permease family